MVSFILKPIDIQNKLVCDDENWLIEIDDIYFGFYFIFLSKITDIFSTSHLFFYFSIPPKTCFNNL